MTNATILMDRLDDAGLLFNVREEALHTATGLLVPNKKVIINEATNTPMGVVSNKYKTVSNAEVFDAFTKALENSSIDMSDAEVSVTQSHHGARSLVDFTFPNHQLTVPGDKKPSLMRVTTLNSYDGSTRLKSRAGAIRMACLNGQLFGGHAGYSSLHNQSLDMKAGALQVSRMLENFEQAGQYWEALIQRKVTTEDVINVFKRFIDGDHKDTEAFLNRPLTKRLMASYEAYAAEMGRNAWAIYNVLTDYVTHKDYKVETSTTARLYNEKKLEDMISSKTSPLALAFES